MDLTKSSKEGLWLLDETYENGGWYCRGGGACLGWLNPSGRLCCMCECGGGFS